MLRKGPGTHRQGKEDRDLLDRINGGFCRLGARRRIPYMNARAVDFILQWRFLLYERG